ncbi:MAG TPA: PQQ-binding-like beta-propeller repeat protein [Ktedonobacteraceae bacterium]|nr:PQQ-binding-like beta-propeller repeat protein [Ktedonobacteraceae bacterium]
MKTYIRRKHCFIWPIMLALLIILAGCGGSSSSNSPSPQPTLVLSPAPSSSSTQGTTSASTGNDWTMYHNDSTRTGYIADAPDPKSLAKAWSANLDGAVYAEPLVVNGHVIVATEGDSLYSLDARTGRVLWHTNVGTPVPLSDLPCGNIDPLGITGTPVYDPQTQLVYAVAEVTGFSHILVGVDVNTGKVRVRQPVDVPGMDARAHQQRAALALANGMVYIAYGGLDGDCSDYIGRVVALHTNGQGPLLVYTVPTSREGGIWAPAGPAVDSGGNVYVAVGNGASTSGNWDHSDSVLKLSPTLQLEDGFAPQQWAQDNAGDADLGSMGPVLLPGGLIYADGKSSNAYLLNANHLGEVGGQIAQASVCPAFGGAAVQGSIIIVPCVDGIRQVIIDAANQITVGWHARGQITGSPIIGGHTVYSLDPGGTLYALSISDGSVVTSLSVGQTSRFATPALSGSMLFVGTLSGVVAVNINS